MDECLFCKIIDKEIPAEIVFENDQAIVFKDINPKAKVHLLIVPKKHIRSLNQLTEEDSELISHLMLQLPQIAQEAGLDSGYRTVINTEAGGGQVVFHLHIHLLGGGHLPAFG